MSDQRIVEELFKKHKYTDFKWIKSSDIVIAEWVRFKCIYGCVSYGKKGSCPPNNPSVSECRDLIKSYEDIIIIHFEKQFDDPEERHNWSKKVNNKLLRLEREVFLAGYHKAFLFFMDECELCKECAIDREKCNNPQYSRPTAEGLAIDVFATVRGCGYPINVVKDYDHKMNRYAFLLVE